MKSQSNPENLTQDAYQALVQNAKVLEADGHGVKVLLLGDGSYLKLFRRKHIISSDIFQPYYRRFVNNCERLAQLGIISPKVLSIYSIPHLKRVAVQYQGIEGSSMHSILNQEQIDESVVAELASFIKRLHEKGVYFRSLHPANIIRSSNGRFGLIDIADMRIFRHPLGRGLRKRNLKHYLRLPADTDAGKKAQYQIANLLL